LKTSLFDKFTVIPSIDLKGGEVVRLLRGEMDRATIYGQDPAATARAFQNEGARIIHVVDLDGAIGGAPSNLESIRAIRAAVGCALDVSGGLRTADSVRAALAAGADYVSIGSAAMLNPSMLAEACREHPGRVFGSLDVREGRLAIKGWRETSQLLVADALERFQQAGVAAVILTDISRDGTENGVDIEMYEAVARSSKTPVIASGGVARIDDVIALRRLFQRGIAGVITGRALYEGRFTLAQAIAAAAEKGRS
jgi:phosphoribosylformimino-5-aminoimidazole carboxamide ribotide isomerase